MVYPNDIAGKRVLVTGASGFIGRCLVELSQSMGANVLPTSRTGRHNCIEMDVTKQSDLAHVFKDFLPEIVFHLASTGVTSRATFSELVSVNTLGTANIVDQCEKLASTQTLLIAGSGYEYSPQLKPTTEDSPTTPPTEYGVSKAAATNYAMLGSKKLRLAVLRLFNVYGPGESEGRLIPQLIRASITRTPFSATSGDQIRDFIYVKDAAEAFIQCLKIKSNEFPTVLNIGSARPIRLRDFIDRAARILKTFGKDLQVNLGAVPYRPGEPMHYEACVAKLRRLTGWYPSVNLDDGLRETIKHHLESFCQ
jgi:UDP-glucose 4-epimerase